MKAKILAATIVAVSAFAVTQAKAEDVYVVPDDADTYVSEQPFDDTVVYDEDIAVGDELPDSVVIREVPSHEDLGYVVTNKRRVIVEPRTRKVIKVYN